MLDYPPGPVITRFRSHAVRPVCAYVARQGGSVQRVLARSGMPADSGSAPFVDVALPSLHRFHDEAAAEIDDPLLGLHVGAQPSLSVWDVMELTAKSASTLGDAVQHLPRSMALFNRWVEMAVSSTSSGCEITHRIPGEPLGLSRHGNELWVMAMLTQVRRATGAHIRPLKVWLAHPAHRQSRQVAAALDSRDVQFGCGSSGVLIASPDLRLPLVTANAAVLQVLDRLSSEIVGRDGGRKRFAALVYDAIRERLDGKVPRIAQVARALSLSTRSLQRELSREGVTFRALVDQVRRDLARARSGDASTSVGETAYQLGYSDPSSLSRARSRWRS